MSIHFKFSLMNHMSAGAEMERYPIFSQGFEKSRAAALHHSFVWERPALSVFSRQQSAQNTPHRHYTDKTRVLASRVKACWVKDSFRKRRVRLFEKAVFPLLMFRSESLTNQARLFILLYLTSQAWFSFSLFNLYMSMRMEAHWASPLPALAHQ